MTANNEIHDYKKTKENIKALDFEECFLQKGQVCVTSDIGSISIKFKKWRKRCVALKHFRKAFPTHKYTRVHRKIVRYIKLWKKNSRQDKHYTLFFYISIRENRVEARYAQQNLIFSLKLCLFLCLDFDLLTFIDFMKISLEY